MTHAMTQAMTQALTWPAFTQALLALCDAGLILPHGILPWTAFPEDTEPPKTITGKMWDAYNWNPPQFAAAALPDIHGRRDAEAPHKPAWQTIVDEATRQARETARNIKLAELAEQVENRKTFTHANRIWQGDTDSAAAITAATLRTREPEDWPSDYVWIDAANNQVPMTPGDMTSLAQALSTWQTARRIHARNLKDAITAATTADEITAIDVTKGWPDETDQAQG